MNPILDFSHPLYQKIYSDIAELRSCKWGICQDNLADNILSLELKKAAMNVYQQFLKGINPESPIFKGLQKMSKKIASHEHIIHYVHSGSQEMDPRISKIKGKIERLNVNNPKTSEKIDKYNSLLDSFPDSLENRDTLTAHGKNQAIEMLNNFRLNMLATSPELKICDFSDEKLVEEYYADVPTEKEDDFLEAGKNLASIEFFNRMLESPTKNKIELCSKNFIELLLKVGHDRSSQLQVDDPYEAAAEDFRKIFRDQDPELKKLVLNKEHRSLPSNVTVERLENTLAFLLDIKRNQNLSSLCMLVSSNELHVTLAIDSLNTLYLFNQYGDEKSNDFPYMMAFSKPHDVAQTLLTLFNELESEEEIKIGAVCNRNEFESRVPHAKTASMLPLTLEGICPPAFYLQSVLEALSPLKDDSYELALGILPQLDVEQYKFDSPITGENRKEILDRIFFHLYYIQNKDRPSIINREDEHWGTSAFQSDVLSTPEEKLRAVQRVQAEFLLSILSKIDFSHPEAQPAIALFLGALTKLQMNPKDLQGELNAGYHLCGNLYNIYLSAWEQNREMIHPHHDHFKGNFGFNAFLSHDSIPPHFKKQAVQQLIQSLKTAWDL